MDLHPYDGKERRFRDDDAGDPSFARDLVARLLRIPIAGRALRYDLSFYSGGIGVIDKLCISIEAADTWRAQRPARFLGAAEAFALEEVRWFLTFEEEIACDAALSRFIAEHRRPFQATAFDQVWIDEESGVNAWTVAYTYQGWLHWLAYDQG